MWTRRLVMTALAATFAGAGVGLQPAHAQDKFPSRAMKLVVPFPAGGPTDVVARHFAAALGRELGQDVIVENKVGAGGAIGAADVARSTPDGYTIIFGTASTHALHNLVAKTQQYDSLKDFAPIALIGEAPLVFVATPKLTGTLPEVLAQGKSKPGTMSYGSPGHGTFMHLAAERLKQMADNPDIAHVAYRGSAPAMNDLVAGQIGLMVDTIATALPQHRTGAARILALAADKRSALASDIPTVNEAMGVQGFSAALWNVVAVPAATPADVVARLNSAAVRIVSDPDFIAKLAQIGVEAAKPTTPAEARAFIAAEREKWKPIVEKAVIVLN